MARYILCVHACARVRACVVAQFGGGSVIKATHTVYIFFQTLL